MQQQTVSARVNINSYSNKVLGTIKLKFDLKDKSDALNKFIELYGENVVEKDATYKYAKKVMTIADKHFNNYGNKKMSLVELDKLCAE